MRYYRDAEVESAVSLSKSKLRTAQRYRLCVPELISIDQKLVRSWDTLSVFTIACADCFSQQTGIPFEASVTIFADVKDSFEGIFAAVVNGADDYLPTIYVIDRLTVAIQVAPDRYLILGNLCRKEHNNRATFESAASEWTGDIAAIDHDPLSILWTPLLAIGRSVWTSMQEFDAMNV